MSSTAEVTPPPTPFVPTSSCLFDCRKTKFLIGLTISVALIIFGALALNGTIQLSAEHFKPTAAKGLLAIGSIGFGICAIWFIAMKDQYNRHHGSDASWMDFLRREWQTI